MIGSGYVQSVTARIAGVYVKLATGLGAGLVGYLRTATNAVLRTLQAKSDDHVSVADFATVQDAVTDVFNNGGKLWVPRGNWALPASVTNLHSIVTYGPGALTRAGQTWYAEPFWNQTNTIFVDVTNGNDANDGLAPGTGNAVKTVARAFAILGAKGPWLNGTWVVQLAAGTYPEAATFPENVRGLNRVAIQGPVVAHPGVPTAIMDGGTTLAFSLNFNGGNKVTVQYIKAQNNTTYGAVAQDYCDLLFNNFHAASVPNGPGIKAQQCRLRVQGGIFTACQTAWTCIAGTTYTIGDPAGASLAGGSQAINCTQAGFFGQEMANGHLDYVTATNCAVALDLTVNSRCHALGCSFSSNATADVRCAMNSSWFNNGTTLGSANTEIMYAGCGEIGRDGSRTSELRQAMDLALVTSAGTSTQTLKTYANALASNSFTASTKAIRLKFYGEITTSAAPALKNITVNLGGSAAFGFALPAGPASTTISYVVEGTVYAQSNVSQSYQAMLTFNGQTAAIVATGSRSISMATGSAIPATIQVTPGAAGETINVRGCEIYNMGGC